MVCNVGCQDGGCLGRLYVTEAVGRVGKEVRAERIKNGNRKTNS